jgi:hypothetical protein
VLLCARVRSLICIYIYTCFVPAQTALDLLTTRAAAAAATPAAVDGGEGTASGRDTEVPIVSFV